jgi:hypothetical protein
MARKRTVYTQKSDFILTVGVKLYSKSDLRTKYPYQYFQYDGVKYEIQNGEIVSVASPDPIFKSISVFNTASNSSETVYYAFSIINIVLGVKIYSNQGLTTTFANKTFRLTQNSIEREFTTDSTGEVISSDIPTSRVHQVQITNGAGNLQTYYVYTAPNVEQITSGTQIYTNPSLSSITTESKIVVDGNELSLNNGSVVDSENVDQNPSGNKIVCMLTQSTNQQFQTELPLVFLNTKYNVNSYRSLDIEIKVKANNNNIVETLRITPDPFVLFQQGRSIYTVELIEGIWYYDLIDFQVGDIFYKDNNCSIPYLKDLKDFLDSYYNYNSNDYIRVIINKRMVKIQISDSQIIEVSTSFSENGEPISIIPTYGIRHIDFLDQVVYNGPDARAYADQYGSIRFNGILMFVTPTQITEDWYGNGLIVKTLYSYPNPNGGYNSYITDFTIDEISEAAELQRIAIERDL